MIDEPALADRLESAFPSILVEHMAVVEASRALAPAVAGLSSLVRATLRAGNKVLFCGNGGSAADCQHLATELTIRFEKNRRALAAIALTTDTSALTAAANDFGIDAMFARQVAALGVTGDLLIGITTSGNSQNVVSAFETAKDLGISTACLTGRDGGRSKDIVDVCITVPSQSTARIQEVHIMIGHALCADVDRAYG